jgi:hypothetical protein
LKLDLIGKNYDKNRRKFKRHPETLGNKKCRAEKVGVNVN